MKIQFCCWIYQMFSLDKTEGILQTVMNVNKKVNKKVLLHDLKRRTARGITCSSSAKGIGYRTILSGRGTPCSVGGRVPLSCLWGIPVLFTDTGVPHPLGYRYDWKEPQSLAIGLTEVTSSPLVYRPD